ncbi:MAG TPA: GDSL-type esterase/lipase family protein [Corynebacterium sp.]|nr:GDSL-type esterase/lipase family protein [Corynebacterium sp.]
MTALPWRATRLAATFLTGAALALAGLLAPAAAHAQTGNVVTFGDSYTASPNERTNTLHIRGSSAFVPNDYPRRGPCLQGPDNWPRQLAAQTGLQVDDWSCNAETTQRMLGRVTHAIESGDIHPGTRAVIFAIGGMDYGLTEGAPITNINAMNERYANMMRGVADQVRQVAPDAQLIISGYPQVTNDTGICMVQVIPTLPLGVPVPGGFAEDVLANMQRYGAEAAGMDFVDNRELTRGHNTCAVNDAQRYVSGLVDFTSPTYEMTLHPTNLGHSAIAAHNAAALGY